MQYLEQSLSNNDLKQDFMDQVWAVLGHNGECEWEMAGIPTGTVDAHPNSRQVHIGVFGFGSTYSVKGFPELNVSLKLVEEILLVRNSFCQKTSMQLKWVISSDCHSLQCICA